jgi:hypothetical protein
LGEVAEAHRERTRAERRSRAHKARWYDVLVHLEDAEHGLRMNELAGRILSSQSGLTRVSA